MNNASLAITTYAFPIINANTGLSDDAKSIQTSLEEVIKNFFRNAMLGEPLGEGLEILDETVQEASVLNWDGYGARPVSDLAYYKARQFLMSLPASIPVPEIGVDPDGDISFNWYFGTDNAFSVSISDKGKLSYAGIFGKGKVHGVEYYKGEIPRTILFNLQRLWDEELNY
jgi:hypothetical protein